MSKAPQVVEKSSESICELMDVVELSWCGNDRSWMRQKEFLSIGTKPSRDVVKLPICASSLDCEYPQE